MGFSEEPVAKMPSSSSEDVEFELDCDGNFDVKDDRKVSRDNYYEYPNDEHLSSSERETGTVIRFCERWFERILDIFTSAHILVDKRSFAASPAATAASTAAATASAATKELIVKQREEEVPLEPFISNPFLMSVCHLRALLNQYRED